MEQFRKEDRSIDDILEARFKSFGIGKNDLDWIYKHDIGKVWSDHLKGIKEV